MGTMPYHVAPMRSDDGGAVVAGAPKGAELGAGDPHR
jgi:hypothetical protein